MQFVDDLGIPMEHREPVIPKIMSSDYLFTFYSLLLQLSGANPDREVHL